MRIDFRKSSGLFGVMIVWCTMLLSACAPSVPEGDGDSTPDIRQVNRDQQNHRKQQSSQQNFRSQSSHGQTSDRQNTSTSLPSQNSQHLADDMHSGSLGLSMTYQNAGSSLQLALDPYDENLHIEMSRSPIEPDLLMPPEEKPTAKTYQKDTLVVMHENSEQTLTEAVPPPPVPSVDDEEDLSEEEPVWEEVTDEVLADIRRAQEAFYKQDYSTALKLVKRAQARRPTAEGYALQGSIHYMTGDRSAARFYWTEALNINPDMPEVVDAIAKLDGGP